jgi:hypothetical protein
MPWKIIINIITLGVPAIIEAIAKARRARREQEARLKCAAIKAAVEKRRGK